MWPSHNNWYYQLILAYEGSAYQGWQKTPMGKSIESTLEAALFQILRHPTSLQAASRTDAGVHAEGQVVQFALPCAINDPGRFLHNLNNVLPKDIRAISIEEKPLAFHPTLDATSKLYTYWICNHRIQLPFYRHLSWHFPYPIELPLIQQSIHHLLGSHDFSAFCNDRSLWTRSPVCTLASIELHPQPHDRLHIAIQGDHFLYKMVRNLVGTLAYIGCGKIPPQKLPSILQSKDRTCAGLTAPAHGLRLSRVFYDS